MSSPGKQPRRVVVPLLPPLTRANQWTCRICGKGWVVPELARDCERKDGELL